MSICCETMNQHIKSFVVPCETGVFAQSTTGKRVAFSEETKKFEFCASPSKYVMKHTKKRYCVSNVERDGKTLTVEFFSAEKINKHGLQWKKEAKCAFDFSTGQYANYFGNTDYWLNNWEELNNSILLDKRSLRFSYPDTVRSCCGYPDYWCCKEAELNLFQFLHKWFNGTLEDYINATKIHFRFQAQSFGVEIEFTGMTKRRAAELIAGYFGTQHLSYFKGISCFKPVDKKNRIWKITHDGSIASRDENNRPIDNPDYKCELVTPILSYEDIPILQEVIRVLRKNGMRVTDSCGIHVHVDDTGHTPFSIMSLVKTFQSNENIIFSALNVSQKRMLHWCGKVNPNFISRYNCLKEKNRLSMTDIKSCWYGLRDDDYSSRYVALNLHSMFTGKGIEFRLFESTTHAGKVKAYIQFCLALSGYAKNHPFSPYYNRSGDGSATYFEQFLTDIGLVGEEFQTARLHLLAVLKKKEEERRTA
mgnify:CR=1 FL=1